MKAIQLLLLLVLPTLALAAQSPPAKSDLDSDALAPVLQQATSTETPQRIEQFSAQFLGRPYEGGTLGGGPGLPETLQMRLDVFDCFTYLDTVEVLRLGKQPNELEPLLMRVRYHGTPAWETRNHFFTDWYRFDPQRVADITRQLGGDATRTASKVLNQKTDGSLWLEGISPRAVELDYIPTAALSKQLLLQLQTGDYIGIYTKIDGLDVTHVGIAIQTEDGWVFRHASSRKSVMQVVDDPLMEYLGRTPGIVVMRPLPPVAG